MKLKLTLHDHESLESLFVALTDDSAIDYCCLCIQLFSVFADFNLSMFVNKPLSEIEDEKED